MAVDEKAVALAGGLTWSLGALFMGLGSMVFPSWSSLVNWLGQFYLGYGPTVVGSVVGAVWGFFDAALGLYVFFWLYNRFQENL
ncbi:MAG: hypothetical protein SVS85_00535 [Candidatus Nanohaloarchaea archaeon]|nr:hypothetical protein [Candidatus Nanohaloarchaea archaeon]